MRPTQLVPVFVAAILVASTSCSDVAAPRSLPVSMIPSIPSITSLSGTIHLSLTEADAGVSLTTSNGEIIPLAGAEATKLVHLENAEVDVRGTWDGGVAFMVNDFVVRRVGGVEVADGILVEMPDVLGDGSGGYALSLTGGSTVELIEPSAELLEHLGERMWVITAEDGRATAFGVIGY